MRILVAFATKHGATVGIAERIGAVLREAGNTVDVLPAGEVGDLEQYDAAVIGSSVYIGAWRREAVDLLRHNAEALAERPVWLFSSGPVGDEKLDDPDEQRREAVSAKQRAALDGLVQPRDHHVFFGLVDYDTFGLGERLMAALPAGRTLLPEGDFRNWPEIEAWASLIAADVAAVPA